MTQADLSRICDVLNTLGNVAWRVNRPILDTIEHIWSNGGGQGQVPVRFNQRIISPEMIRQASFREKLKLLKEH